jgi:hypothetical protein
MRVASTNVARWYLCECDRPSCREEFYLEIRAYERGTLGEAKFVVPEHKPTGAPVLARWNGVVMIGRSR